MISIPTGTTTTTEETGDRMVLHKDGTISIHIDDDEVILRRPKMRELKRAQKLSKDVNQKRKQLTKPVRAKAKDARLLAERARNEEEDIDPEELREQIDDLQDDIQDLADEANMAAMELMFEVWAEVANMLDGGGDAFPDEFDDCPIWLLTDGEKMGDCMQHWQSAPLVRG